MNDREDVIILFVLTVINGKKLSILTAFTKLRKSNAKIEKKSNCKKKSR